MAIFKNQMSWHGGVPRKVGRVPDVLRKISARSLAYLFLWSVCGCEYGDGARRVADGISSRGMRVGCAYSAPANEMRVMSVPNQGRILLSLWQRIHTSSNLYNFTFRYKVSEFIVYTFWISINSCQKFGCPFFTVSKEREYLFSVRNT